MPYNSISKLGRPPSKYWGAGYLPSLETAEDARREDLRRARRLRRYAAQLVAANKVLTGNTAYALADYLCLSPTERKRLAQRSLASAADMRHNRRAVTGWTHSLFDRTSHLYPTTFTLASRTLELRDLSELDARKMVNGFRSDLNRSGAASANGYLMAHVHGEFDTFSKVYRAHFHGLVAGDMTRVLDTLRTKPKYKSVNNERSSLRIRRKPIDDVPYALSYLLKGYWPATYCGPVSTGAVVRQSSVSRIPEPWHSEVLLWQHRWALEDITLMVGLEVHAKGRGFRPTKAYTNFNTNDARDGADNAPYALNRGV